MFLFSPPHRQRGGFLVLSAVILPLFLLIAGVCIDIGAMYLAKSNQQNAADAAALAGAQELPDADKADAMARDYLVRNGFSRAIADAANVEILENNTKCRVTFEAPAKLVVFGGLFESGPTIRARAAAIGTQGGGYAIFADTDMSWDNQHALYISLNNTLASGNIHSNNGIGVSGSLNLSPGEITCMTGHSNEDVYTGSLPPAIKHVAKQPFPNRSGEIILYKINKHHDASDIIALTEALKTGEAAGIYTTGSLVLYDIQDAAARQNLRFIIARGNITLSLASTTLGSAAQPVFIASENGHIDFKTSIPGDAYADFYAPNSRVEIQANNTNFSGSIAGKSVTLQLNSLKAGSGFGSSGRTLRLVE